MDDIYGDLENYNDVNAIEELRNENKQLKFKVEESEAEIARLQKRLELLQTEHNRMSTNYSSLLKTAKAEVERKTQIITTLNQEKDTMILNSLKNSDKSLQNIRKNLLRNNHINNVRSPKEPEIRKPDIERDRRKDEHRYPSEDTVISSNTDEANTKLTDKKTVNSDPFHDKLESKENTSQAQGIRNRRKSMPYSKPITYTSDEENDSANEYKADRSREEKHRRNERARSKHKVSETSGIDDKYSSYHESSRETYKSRRLNREMRERYRSHKDKYDPRRRRDSPERRRPMEDLEMPDSRHRVLKSPPGEIPEHRYEHRRARERQPNPDRAYSDRSRSRHDNRPIKHKLPNDDEPIPKRARPEVPNTEIDETIHKQSRTDKLTDQHEHLNKDDISKKARTEHRQAENNSDDKKNKVKSEDKIVNSMHDLHEDSCMSPDYNQVEVPAKIVPKEIKLTSSAKLDDPRLKSSKYIVKTENENKTLSTAIGRNVDIKPIDKSTWNIPKVSIPEALQKPPEDSETLVKDLHVSKYYDNLVKDVYMDIENPVSNLSGSLESGEIQSDTNDTPYARAVAASFFADYENIKEQDRKSHRFDHTTADDKITFHPKPQNVFPEKINMSNEVASIMTTLKSSSEKIHTEAEKTFNTKKKVNAFNSDVYVNKSVSSYKIPKFNKSESAAETKKHNKYRIQEPSAAETKEHNKYKIQEPLKEKINSKSKTHSPTLTGMQDAKLDKDKPTDKKCKETNNSLSYSDISSTLQSSNESLQDANTSKPKIVLKLSELKGYRKLSPREIVAGDLELSDDTNDLSFSEFSRKEPKSKSKKHSHDKKSKTKDSETADKSAKSSVADTISNETKEIIKKEKRKDGDQSKSNMSKKETKPPSDKITKFQDLFGDSPSSSIDKIIQNKGSHCVGLKEAPVDKEDKTKDVTSSDKSTTKSNEKLKFTELFGDSVSCSLMTPEDLGLNISESQPHSYMSVFEDAQDAVDINKKQIKTSQNDLPNTVIEVDNTEKLATNKTAVTAVIDTNYDETNKDITRDKHGDLDVAMIYKNLFLGDEDTKDTEVVQTVLLATGMQTRENCQDSNNAQTSNEIDLVKTSSGLPNLQEVHKFATSTPYRPTQKETVEKINKVDEMTETSSMSSNLSSRSSTIDLSSVSSAQVENGGVVRIKLKRRTGKKR